MIAAFIPVFKLPVSYTVAVGRRWSVLEHLLLVRLAIENMAVPQLVVESLMPERMVVEALINLLRAGWIEVRSQEDGNFFTATPAGKRRATEEELPTSLQNEIRWMTLCVERLTGSWLRANDITMVHEKDLPEDALILEAGVQTYDPLDGQLRPLLYIGHNDFLQPDEPNCHRASNRYAKVTISTTEILGLPDYISPNLESEIRASVKDIPDKEVEAPDSRKQSSLIGGVHCSLDSTAFIVGGEAHKAALIQVLEDAKSYVAVHSCFIHPDAIQEILPALEAAANRNIKIDLIWGLHIDPEDPKSRTPILHSEAVLASMSPKARRMVTLSQISSGSHGKLIVYDSRSAKGWTSIVGSCNFLSSRYDQIEISVKVLSTELAHQLVGQLLSIQIPASGAWPSISHRLNRVWDATRTRNGEAGGGSSDKYRVRLLRDLDHYACIRNARDHANSRIHVGCDLFGMAAETSVLVPMSEAVKDGANVRLFYQRPSQTIRDAGITPERVVQKRPELAIYQVPKLHGKFLYWDENHVAVTSFNWMSAAIDGTRARGAEFGLLIEGPNAAKMLEEKLARYLQPTISR